MDIEVTIGDIENILLAHKTLLPRDVIENLYDEYADIFNEIIANAKDCTDDKEKQWQFVYSTIERMMILDGLYITEPSVY
jgi:hypothetical protein